MNIPEVPSVVRGQCGHFPERVYEWKEAGGYFATCASCGTDYGIERVEGVTVNNVPLYVPSDWLR